MLVDEKQLRCMGIDLCSRTRRRWAVALTYAGFLTAVWIHPSRTESVLDVLWIVWLSGSFWKKRLDAMPLWGRRVCVSLALLLAVATIFVGKPAATYRQPTLMMNAMFFLVVWSVVGWDKLVESRGHRWLAESIDKVEKGQPLNRRRQRRLARCGFAVGLDGFAWHEYAAWFKHLNDEQKLEIEAMGRAHPRGRWMRTRSSVLFDDERMRAEDDRIRAQVQQVLSSILGVSATAAYLAIHHNHTISQEMCLAWVFTLAALATTLPQAIALWTEEDPRGLTAEIAIVHRVEA